jgi:hypothetical protein
MVPFSLSNYQPDTKPLSIFMQKDDHGATDYHTSPSKSIVEVILHQTQGKGLVPSLCRSNSFRVKVGKLDSCA